MLGSVSLSLEKHLQTTDALTTQTVLAARVEIEVLIPNLATVRQVYLLLHFGTDVT